MGVMICRSAFYYHKSVVAGVLLTLTSALIFFVEKLRIR